MSDTQGQDATAFNLSKASESANEHRAAGWGRDCLSEQRGQLGSRLSGYKGVRP